MTTKNTSKVLYTAKPARRSNGRVVPGLPPQDGEWYEATVGGRGTVPVQYDKALGRWFDGRSHGVAATAIISWFDYSEARPAKAA